MQASQMHYLPLSPPFFSILVAIFIALVLLLQLGALHYAYTRIGISARAALLLLLASLIGSYINIPVAELPAQSVMSGREVVYFGMRYVVPVVVQWPTTVLAVNVGGVLIATVVSLSLLAKNDLWGPGAVAIAIVAFVIHMLAQPVPGVGIAVPVFVPLVVTAVVALLLSRDHAAPLA